MTDSTHSIIHSAKRFFSGTMLSRFSGMFRDMSMAFIFGTQESIAGFLVAFRLAHLLRRLLGEGALQTAFVPHFEALRANHPQDACRFFRDLTALLIAFLSGIIVMAMLALGYCLTQLELSSGNREIVFLSFLLMPSLLFICLFGLNASLLQCEKNFFMVGVAPVAFNVIWVLGVFSLWHLPASSAMPWLAGWVIVACLCQWLMTVPQTLAILRKNGLRQPWQGVRLYSSELSGLVKSLLLGIMGVAATQINNAFDVLFARYADMEGPALLWYALRLQQLPLALFGIAIAGALLPPLTRALKNHDLPLFLHFFDFSVRRTIVLMLPITTAIFVMGDSGINLIYGHGDFTDVSIVGTTCCLWGYGLGLIPMTLVLILASAFYAQHDWRTPAIASLASVGMNIVLNFFLIMCLGYGAASVAIATSVSAWINVAILATQLVHCRTVMKSLFFQAIGKTLFASLLAALAVLMIDLYGLQGSTVLDICIGKMPTYSHHVIAQLTHLSIQFASFCLVLGSCVWLLNATDLLFFFSGQKESQTMPTST